MKEVVLVALVSGALLAGSAAAAQQYPFQNPNLPVEQRINNVLSLMTLQEKIDFLGTSLNVQRLGIHAEGAVPTIPGSGGQFEGLHGLAVGGPGLWARRSPGKPGGTYGGITPIPTTQFPQTVGMGATWDPGLIQQAAREEGMEARFIFQSYNRGGLIVRAPNADLERDPRWGRSEESYGEDPLLTGTMATAFVKGLQGDDPKYWLTISLVKHFMANSNEDGRQSSSSNFDASLLHEYYSFPFRMAIEQGGANALMASYNAVNHVPMTVNPLLKSLVMKQWGFNGLIDTDRGSLTNLVTRYHYYPDPEHAVAACIHAGINQFLNPYVKALQGALAEKLLTEQDIDQDLRGLFRVLIRTGMLDEPASSANPYIKIDANAQSAPWDSPQAKDLDLRITRESIVLLKNSPLDQARLLPLDLTKLKSIAVLGPFADKVEGDSYGGVPPFAVSPLQGIQNAVGKGVAVRSSQDPAEAVAMAKSSDVAIVVVGNDPTCSEWFGRCSDPSEGKEAVDRKQIDLNPAQEKLVEDVYAANPRTIVVLISSFPYAIDWEQQHVSAIVHMAHCSEVEGTALAEVLFGSYDPGGHLVVTWPRSLSQLPPMMDYNLRDGRTYMYMKGQPLYPFGYGLSYTSFKYSKLRVSSTHLAQNGHITASLEIANTGKVAGDEVVQLYVQDPEPQANAPKEQLKGFERISLEPGAAKTVSFQLAAKDLAHWDDAKNEWSLRPGRLRLLVGASSADIRATKLITVAKP